MSPLIVMFIIFSVLFCKEKLLAYLDRRKENYKRLGLLACVNDFTHEEDCPKVEKLYWNDKGLTVRQ